MKVGTDAVLLGAWVDVEGAKSTLDIGTGSGIIAIMIAQRTPSNAIIDAVELQPEDARQAAENILASTWRSKITVISSSIQDYQPGKPYDLIVCNPPFFSNSLQPPSAERTRARHQKTLSQKDLVDAASRLLAPSGRLGVIMPPVEGETFVRMAEGSGLFLQRITRFYSRAGKPQERSLMEFGFSSMLAKKDALVLYSSGSQWTEDYRRLTGDFYLER